MSVSHPRKSRTKLTYEHYTQFPDDGMRHEIIDGDHYKNAAPVPDHQKLSGRIHFQLYSAIELPNLGDVVYALIDVQFSNHDVVQPDIIDVLNDNRIITQTKVKGAPDLVVEILSPSTSQRDEGLNKNSTNKTTCPNTGWLIRTKKPFVNLY